MKKVFITAVLLSVTLAGCSLVKEKSLSLDEAKTKVKKFIDTELMNQGEVTIKDVVEEYGLYKLTVVLPNKQEVVSYLTKDGKKFFPQAIDVKSDKATSTSASAQSSNTPVASVSKKIKKPNVELFVMSYCPYGTQIEKGILPVVETLHDKIDFNVKFCDYAMHGEKELDENLNQYCIQKEQPDKFLSYLKCFLNASDGAKCLKSVGVDVKKMNKCVSATDNLYAVKKEFKDKSTWTNGQYPMFNVEKDDNLKYGVQGSPTLIINGENISAGRDSKSLLSAICSGFEVKPEACSAVLPSEAPSPGFGFGKTGADTTASCN